MSDGYNEFVVERIKPEHGIIRIACLGEPSDYFELLQLDGGVDFFLDVMEAGEHNRVIISADDAARLRAALPRPAPMVPSVESISSETVERLAEHLRHAYLVNLHGDACAEGMPWSQTSPEVRSPWLAVALAAHFAYTGAE